MDRKAFLKVVAAGLASASIPAAASGSADLWVPALVGTSVPGNHNYHWKQGRYTVVNDFVMAYFSLAADVDLSISGNVTITGLPFANESAADASVTIGEFINIDFSHQAGAIVVPTERRINLMRLAPGGLQEHVLEQHLKPFILISGSVFYATNSFGSGFEKLRD